jgi:AcrR family transcriptional regulator
MIRSSLYSYALLTHGGFYKHFGRKDDLLVEITERGFREIQETLVRAAEQAPLAKRGRQS